MSTNKPSRSSKSVYQLASLTLYILIIVIAAALLIIEPNGLEVKALIIPLIFALFISALGIGQRVTAKSEKRIAIFGTIAISILLTFVGFFIVAGVAWLVGLSHAQ